MPNGTRPTDPELSSSRPQNCESRVCSIPSRMCASTPGPEAGAQCGSAARWDLYGGPPARAVPTVIPKTAKVERRSLARIRSSQPARGARSRSRSPPTASRSAGSACVYALARQRDRHFDAYQELSPQEDSGCQEVEEVSFDENVGSGRNLSHGLVLTPDAPVGSQNSIVGAE